MLSVLKILSYYFLSFNDQNNFLNSALLRIMRLQYSLRSAQVLAKYSRCNGFHNFLSIHHTVPNIITFSRFYSSLQYATSTSSNSFSFSFKLPLLCVTLNTFVVPRREAGHSHFANIKHTKAAMDQAKAVNIQRHIGLIRIAIRGTFQKLDTFFYV